MTSSHHESNDSNRRRYRSRNDIISELLTLALEGTTKTKLMYGAFLSYRQIQEYLPLLLENGFMIFDGTEKNTVPNRKAGIFSTLTSVSDWHQFRLTVRLCINSCAASASSRPLITVS